MRLGVLVAASLALAALAPVAVAQGQGTLTIAIPDLPPGPSRVNAGQAQTIGFTVEVMAAGFQCTAPGTITVDLAISNAGAAPPGVTVAVEPANLTFDVPGPAVYGLPAPAPVPGTEPYNQSMPATLRISTTAAASGQFSLSVAASRAAGQVCEPTGDLPAGSATATHAVAVVGQTPTNMTPPGPVNGNNTTQPPPTEQPPPSRGLPGFEAALVVAAVAVLALGRRRA